MNRRDFIRYLLATPIAAELDVEKLLWILEKKVFIPEFNWKTIPIIFHGIPYHQTNASSGTWLGFSRSDANTIG
jgi:hypothetical protein